MYIKLCNIMKIMLYSLGACFNKRNKDVIVRITG